MNYLYILSEDESDSLFYEACLEKLTGKTFTKISRRSEPASGLTEVRRNLRFFLSDIVRTGHVENSYFLIAIDNDRSPVHPDHAQIDGLSRVDRSKTCRFCELTKAIEDKLGTDHAQWPIKGAIAVPVEMLESWLLTMLGYEVEALPFFPEKRRAAAQNFYSPKQPPDQLKDLCEQEQAKLNISNKKEFYLHCVFDAQCDLDTLAKMSDSFALFKAQVEAWT